MRVKRIKIGHQQQADLPIYLLQSGRITCGSYEYKGTKARGFRSVFEAISSMVECTSLCDDLDVSAYRFWDAMEIYEQHIARPWKKSISAKKMEQLKVETEISLMLKPLRDEFKRAVSAKWNRERPKVFSQSSSDGSNRPTQGWHLFSSVALPGVTGQGKEGTPRTSHSASQAR